MTSSGPAPEMGGLPFPIGGRLRLGRLLTGGRPLPPFADGGPFEPFADGHRATAIGRLFSPYGHLGRPAARLAAFGRSLTPELLHAGGLPR